MHILFSAADAGAPPVLPVELIFWGFVVAYILHIIEESVLGEVFVEKVRRKYWSEYDWGKFAGFNTLLLTLNIAAVIVFESAGGAWIIVPLSLAAERVLNGLYHLLETLKTKRYSSGLLTSVIFWILAYLPIRYAVVPGEIAGRYVLIGAVIGAATEVLMMGSLTQMKRLRG